MKIEYKTTLGVDGKPVKYNEVRHVQCCPLMHNHLGHNDTLEFGVSGDNKAAPVVSLVEHEFSYYGDHDKVYHAIVFCPWCAKKIVCEEVERVKIIETRTKVQRIDEVVKREESSVWRKDGH